jgi:hypothetical protein
VCTLVCTLASYMLNWFPGGPAILTGGESAQRRAECPLAGLGLVFYRRVRRRRGSSPARSPAWIQPLTRGCGPLSLVRSAVDSAQQNRRLEKQALVISACAWCSESSALQRTTALTTSL